MRVAVIQMASGSIVKGNMLEAKKLIKNAVDDGADIIVLPENFGMITANEPDILQYGEVFGDGPLQDFLAQQSAEHSIYLVGGTLPVKSEYSNKIRNTLLVYDPQGECISRYDKIHLFDVKLPSEDEQYHESSMFEPGEEIVVLQVGDMKLGLAICYDLRFPELFRALVDKGAEVIVLPAAFTAVTGKAHWHTLLKARAIENLCYLAASAQGGYHVNGRETYGHSLIVDPWGKVIDEIDSGSGYAIADINLSQQQQIRERFPVLTHRKISRVLN
jgi:deaminated glutathione amidase